MITSGRASMEKDAPAAEADKTSEAALAEGYRQMAADREREAEAEEWTEHILFELEDERSSGY
jgi:hypothetical protein